MTLARQFQTGVLAKAMATGALLIACQILFDGSRLGAALGAFALAWSAALALTQRAVTRGTAARIALVIAVALVGVLVDDPSVIGWVSFWVALSLAAVLPRRGFDEASIWARRLVVHAATGLVSPFRDAARLSAAGQRGLRGTMSVRAVIRLLLLPVGGGAVFLALFASANPLIETVLAEIALPDAWTVVWRSVLAGLVVIAVWPSLRPSSAVTRMSRTATRAPLIAYEPGAATLTLALVTFNVVFALQNGLDIAFLWSGAPLPAGVTLADYAHRGAYALIVTALLAGAFVMVAMRPGSPGAATPSVRALVMLWIAQNVLLVASSALRTLDYVDAYGMTELRLAALAWMGLVAVGLALIGWRLRADRSAAWLINANALAAAAVIVTASVVDLGATAAAWNTRVALQRGRSGPQLDLCYLGRLGPSALVSLAGLERHARDPALRERLGWLRWNAQNDLLLRQGHWRSWTPRGARRLSAAEAIAGKRSPALRPAPNGRGCDGSIVPPPPPPAAPPAPPPLTKGPQQ
ncbi:DUF4153 domain-containing protein [Sphingomonas glacialis]|uniref:DUF4173 domain-containing protein n=1 Tax=Sphingomonas glacialis TaxID=658225 RepID=A0A502G4Z2_9SPHN|nr:DUF4173 domain-containing protein [Sphingomonas glacialis]TPG56480.1 DUF4173 domain-containing protein [Sphingomonas glacialis]